MNTTSLIVLLCVVVAAVHAVSDADQFAAFISQYNRNYQTSSEWDLRFEVFKNNLRKIEELNAKSNGVTHGINQFADMTEKEFNVYPCGGNLIGRFPNEKFPEVEKTNVFSPNDIPTSFDWSTQGAVTPIKDQGQCGSCWAFSTIANIEGAWKLAGNTLVSLAESELVDCTKTSYGCGGGWPFWALTDILKAPYNGRIDTEASYPYSPSDGKCKFNAQTVGATVKNFTNYCHEGTTPCTELQIQTLLMKLGPLSICLDASAMQLYKSGVSQPSNCSPQAIDHCIALVGWGVDPISNLAYWKLKNSWGFSWGEQGYYRLIRGVAKDQPMGRCGINTVVTATAVV